MKVLTGQQMKELDQQAIEGMGIPSLVLMENAGKSALQIIKKFFPNLENKRIVVFSGKGNNGGDGLVVARHLYNAGVSVKVFILGEKEELSPETKTNSQILENIIGEGNSELTLDYLPTEKSLDQAKRAISQADLIIDALLGIGIKGAVRGYYKTAIKLINQSPGQVCSIDVPSGLEADTGRVEGECVGASLTVTMELPKLGCLFYPGKRYVGELKIAEVGYPKNLIEKYKSGYELIDETFVKKKLPVRDPYSHKGDYGRVFILAGSKGMTGAASLAAESALRSGAGLVYLGIPESLNQILEAKLTEVITLPLPESEGALNREAFPHIVEFLEEMQIDSVALGPGLSQKERVAKLINKLLPEIRSPLVIDADGLNNLVSNSQILKKLEAEIILTPHPGELSRLIGKGINEIEANRVSIAKETAAEYSAILTLKGVPTVTATPIGELFINPTGNTGLASGGSGDVLCGLIAGFLAQGMEAEYSASIGAYLHGLIADRCVPKTGERGIIAGDLVRGIPHILKMFEI